MTEAVAKEEAGVPAAGVRMTMAPSKKKSLAPQPAAAGFASASELREAAPKEEAVEGLLTAAPAEAAAPAAAEPLDEDAEAAQALRAEVRSSGGAGIFGNGAIDEAEMYRLDVATRAESATEEAYERMPIEEFGKAYLRGYSWKEGESVGKNGEVVEPVEYVPRPQLLGLGAQPKADDGGDKSKKKFIKPGESREKKKDMVYIDEQGRQRTSRRWATSSSSARRRACRRTRWWP